MDFPKQIPWQDTCRDRLRKLGYEWELIGLLLSEEVFESKKRYQDHISPTCAVVTNVQRPWSFSEENLLETGQIQQVQVEHLAFSLGRSVEECENRLRLIEETNGFRHHASWTEGERNNVFSLHQQGLSVRDISSRVRINYFSCAQVVDERRRE